MSDMTVGGVNFALDTSLNAAASALATAQNTLANQLAGTFNVSFGLPTIPTASTRDTIPTIASDAAYSGTDLAVNTTAGAAFASVSAGSVTASASTVAIANAVAVTDVSANLTGVYVSMTDNDAAIVTALSTYITNLKAVALPTLKPVPPVLTEYNTMRWTEDFWTDLKTKMAVFLSGITGSDDVDTVVTKLTSETSKMQVAIYAADVERKQQGLRDAYSAANMQTGSKGFTFPNCMTKAIQLGATQEYLFELSQVSRDLVKLIFDWAKSNYQFTVQQHVSAHNADVEYNTKFANTLVEAYQVEMNSLIGWFNASLAAEVAKLEGIVKEYQLRIEAAKTAAAIEELEDKALLSTADIKVRIEGMKTEISKTNAGIGETLAKNTIEVARINVTTAEGNARNMLEAARINTMASEEYAKNTLEAARINTTAGEANARNKLQHTANELQRHGIEMEAAKLVYSDAREKDRVMAQNYAIACSTAVNGTQAVVSNNMALMRERIGGATAAVTAAAQLASSQSASVVGIVNG